MTTSEHILCVFYKNCEHVKIMGQLFTPSYYAELLDMFWSVDMKENFWKPFQKKCNIENESLCTALYWYL